MKKKEEIQSSLDILDFAEIKYNSLFQKNNSEKQEKKD